MAYTSCILALLLEDNQDKVKYYNHIEVYKTKEDITEMVTQAENKYFNILKNNESVEGLIEKHNTINCNNIYAYIKNYTDQELIDLEKEYLDDLSDQDRVALAKAIARQGSIDFLWYFNYKVSSDYKKDTVKLKNSKGDVLDVQAYPYKGESMEYFKEVKKVYEFIDSSMVRDYKIWRAIKDDEK